MRVALVVLVALLTSTAVLADDAALVERIRQLEATVDALSARVTSLEAARTRPEAPPQTKPWTLPVGNSPVLGPKDARYTLVVFGDLQCPFCRRIDPFLRELVDDPELKGKVNVVFKHYPLSFHKQARPAARIAIGVQKVAGDVAAWDFMGLVYAATDAELGDDLYLRTLDRLKLPRGAVLEAAQESSAQLAADAALAEQAGIRGTPTLFVNGWELKRRSVEGVKALIAERAL